MEYDILVMNNSDRYNELFTSESSDPLSAAKRLASKKAQNRKTPILISTLDGQVVANRVGGKWALGGVK